jgi:small subunit ribosomal protein S20
MPIIKSAIKKMRKDKKITVRNQKTITAYKETLKKLKKAAPAGGQGGTELKALVSKFYSQVDRAVKNKVIHKNKGNRLKAKVAQVTRKK